MKIAILTTARSDFGPLKPVIRHASERFEVDLLVAGCHFLASHGETIKEIEHELAQQNVDIVLFDAVENVSSVTSQVSTVANTQLLASQWFSKNRCDLLLFLGDRWELWGVTLAAFLHGIPMAHISGGEVTEGVIDDCVRHSHTKLASLHFAATNEYARNISLMGEEDWRISVVEECGLDLIHFADVATPEQVKEKFEIDLMQPTLLVTFHPSTLDLETPAAEQIDALLLGLRSFSNHQVVFTAPGIEQGSDVVLAAIRDFVAIHPNAILIEHFGSHYYLSVMKSAKAVIGNSSSGLIEAPSFGVPAINIGLRQKNRLAADSVQHVGYDAAAIETAITRALTISHQDHARSCQNPYDPFRDGKNSLRIVQAIEHALKAIPVEQLRVKKFDNQIHADQWNQLYRKAI